MKKTTMKKPKFGSKAWMAYIRSLKGKKGHTSKSKSTSKQKHSANVVVKVPAYAKLKILKTPHNPYMMDVTETNGNTTTHHKWYSDDYSPID